MDTVGAKAVVSYSASGATGLYISRERPDCHIIVLTSNMNVARTLSFVWGVYPVIVTGITNFQEMVENSQDILFDLGLLKKGDYMVVTGSDNIGVEGSTDCLRVVSV